MQRMKDECELVEGWFSEFLSISYVYGEVDGFGTDGVADFLDDPFGSYCDVLVYFIYCEPGFVIKEGRVPMVSISRASIL